MSLLLPTNVPVASDLMCWSDPAGTSLYLKIMTF